MIQELESPVMSPDTQITSFTTPDADDSSLEDDGEPLVTWSPIISIHPLQRMYKIANAETCTVVEVEDSHKAIRFQNEVKDLITHVRIFPSHNDDAIINAT
jgi:hypothetical protein